MTSNQITKIPSPPQNIALTGALGQFVSLSPRSGGLEATGGRYNEMRVDLTRHATPKVVAEAKKALPEMEALLERPSPEQHSALVHLFCTSMMMAVNNGPSDAHSMGLKQAAIRMATQNYPAVCWNTEIIATAMSKFQFWPSVAEIVKLLDSYNEPLQARVNQLRALAELKITAPRARRQPTEDEKLAVEKAVAELRAENEARAKEEAAIRKFGQWMPENCVGKTGTCLADGLEEALRLEISPPADMVRVTLDRIEMLRHNARLLDAMAS